VPLTAAEPDAPPEPARPPARPALLLPAALGDAPLEPDAPPEPDIAPEPDVLLEPEIALEPDVLLEPAPPAGTLELARPPVLLAPDSGSNCDPLAPAHAQSHADTPAAQTIRRKSRRECRVCFMEPRNRSW
jgi:hypothetical protein